MMMMMVMVTVKMMKMTVLVMQISIFLPTKCNVVKNQTSSNNYSCNISCTCESPNSNSSCSCSVSPPSSCFSFISNYCTASNPSCQATTFLVKFTFIDFANFPSSSSSSSSSCTCTCTLFPKCNGLSKLPISSICTKSTHIVNISDIVSLDTDKNCLQKAGTESLPSKFIDCAGIQTLPNCRNSSSKANSKNNSKILISWKIQRKLSKKSNSCIDNGIKTLSKINNSKNNNSRSSNSSSKSKSNHKRLKRSQRKSKSKRLGSEEPLKRSQRGAR